MMQQVACPAYRRPVERIKLWWQIVAAVMIVLSLGLGSPLACILHCMTFAPADAAPTQAPARIGLICFLGGHERPSPSNLPHAHRVPPALYQFAPALSQQPLVIVALALALLVRTCQLAPQLAIAPPTPPPRRPAPQSA